MLVLLTRRAATQNLAADDVVTGDRPMMVDDDDDDELDETRREVCLTSDGGGWLPVDGGGRRQYTRQFPGNTHARTHADRFPARDLPHTRVEKKNALHTNVNTQWTQHTRRLPVPLWPVGRPDVARQRNGSTGFSLSRARTNGPPNRNPNSLGLF